MLGSVLEKGLRAKAPSSFPYLRLIVEHHLGLPEQVISMKEKVVLAPRD